jgi:hypothetical protein
MIWVLHTTIMMPASGLHGQHCKHMQMQMSNAKVCSPSEVFCQSESVEKTIARVKIESP